MTNQDEPARWGGFNANEVYDLLDNVRQCLSGMYSLKGQPYGHIITEVHIMIDAELYYLKFKRI